MSINRSPGSGPVVQFGYDVENRLLTAPGSNGGTQRYGYDPLGRLAVSHVEGSGANLSRFLYDGEALVAEYDASGTMTRRYIHGPGIDQPLMEERDPQSARIRQNLFPDMRGSLVAVGWVENGLQSRVNRYDVDGVDGGRADNAGLAWANTADFIAVPGNQRTGPQCHQKMARHRR